MSIYKQVDPPSEEKDKPISILPSMSKISDRVACNRIYNFLKK